MKLRTHLLIANGISIGFILIFLIFSYIKMFISFNAIMWLSVVTIIAGIISFFTHVLLTRPIQKAIHLISLESNKIASGDFDGKVPQIGPIEFKELANRFNDMSDKLEESFTQIQQAESSRKELVANISHDLRTPLASIQSFVEALQDNIIDDEDTYQRYLQTIKLETKRLSHLINDLFQLSQLESGREAYQPIPYHLDDLILETLQNQYLQLEEHKMEVSVQLPDKIAPAAIMPEKIKRVLINLIQNAIRYSPKGSTIGINVEETMDDEIKVIISDQGEGISVKELPHVFDRFYRIEKSRNKEYGGIGLGLSIAKSNVELHGGRIGVESKLGEGSSFWFTIPKYK